MAGAPKFYDSDHTPLAEFLTRVRCFTFEHLQEFLRAYYLQYFPPNHPTGKRDGWNRHCNLATRYRLQNYVERSEILSWTERHRNKTRGVYCGAWIETSFERPFDENEFRAAIFEDLHGQRGEKAELLEFYSPHQMREIVEEYHRTDGRGEFINSQHALAEYYVYLTQSTDPRLHQIAESWELVPLPSSFSDYFAEYRGDAIASDDQGEILICSPAIFGWHEGPGLRESIKQLVNKLSGTRCLFLSPLGFKRWRKQGPIDLPGA